MFNDLLANNAMCTVLTLDIGDVDGDVIGTRNCTSDRIYKLELTWKSLYISFHGTYHNAKVVSEMMYTISM